MQPIYTLDIGYIQPLISNKETVGTTSKKEDFVSGILASHLKSYFEPTNQPSIKHTPSLDHPSSHLSCREESFANTIHSK